MPVTSKFYPNAVNAMFNGELNASDTFKMALVKSTYTYSDAHTAYSDISSHEVSGSAPGYTAGGYTYAGITSALSSTKTTFSIPLALWLAATFDFRYAVIYSSTNNKLMMFIDLGEAQSLIAKNYQISGPSPAPSATIS